MTSNNIKPQTEVEKLKYSSNHVSWAIILPWVALLTYCVVYLARYMWPDLIQWLK